MNTMRRRIAWKSPSSTISLKKKSERKDLMKYLLQGLEGGAGLAKKAKRGKLPKNPWKETKIPVGGD
jgi:hypothetical protein